MPRAIFFLIAILILCQSPRILLAEDNSETLISKADILLEQKAYEPGISVLEIVLKKNPDQPKALGKLLQAYDDYSKKLLEKGQFEKASRYIEKMDPILEKLEKNPLPNFTTDESGIQTRIARERASIESFLQEQGKGQAEQVVKLDAGREQYNEAVKHFQKHEYDIAEELLVDSISYDDKNAYAYELMGEIANLRQDMEKAGLYYRKAFSLNPDPRLRIRLEQIDKEGAIDKSQQQYADEHFIIRYRRNGKFEGSEIRELLRAAYRSISQEFGFYPKHQITVTLYDRDEFESLYGQLPHWLVAMFDGKIRLPVYSENATQSDLVRYVNHELTHAFVLNISELKCPVWLNEGLAQYFENKIKPIVLDGLRIAVRKNALADLNELMVTKFSEVSSHELVGLYYLQSFSITLKLMDDFGAYKMKQLLIELGKGKQFLEAFETVYGRSFWDFASDWKKEVMSELK